MGVVPSHPPLVVPTSSCSLLSCAVSESAPSPCLWWTAVTLWGAAADPCLPREGWLRVKCTADFPRTSKGASLVFQGRCLRILDVKDRKDLLGHIPFYLPAKEGLFCTGIRPRSVHLALLQLLPAWGSLIRPMRLCRALCTHN